VSSWLTEDVRVAHAFESGRRVLVMRLARSEATG